MIGRAGDGRRETENLGVDTCDDMPVAGVKECRYDLRR